MKLLVVGAGGHAKVVVDAACAHGDEVVAVLGDARGTSTVLGAPVVSTPEGVSADGFIVAVGDNASRQRIFQQYVDAGLEPVSVIHPSATIAASAVIAAGTFVAAGVVVNPDARIERNVILNTGCTVDHDCVVADHAHIGPGVSLCGGVTVGEGCLIGVGASAMPGVRIGAWTVLGAGGAAVSDLPPRSVCVGVPARLLRAVDAES